MSQESNPLVEAIVTMRQQENMKCAVYHHIKGLGGSIRVSVDDIEKDTEMAGLQMVYHDDTNEIELVCVTKEQINALNEKINSGVNPS